jgi:hypothetical protein
LTPGGWFLGLAKGTEIFTFWGALTCEALENFDLSESTADYVQRFPSVVVELPADYTRRPEAGCVLLAMHRPRIRS